MELERAAGRIAARALGAYPPGVAECAPGEEISREICERLIAAQRAGAEKTVGARPVRRYPRIMRQKEDTLPMYDYVLFDLDGTLTDSARGILASVDYAIERMGFASIPEEKRRLYVGPPRPDFISEDKSMTLDQLYEAVAKAVPRAVQPHRLDGKPRIRGYPRMLRALKSRGVYLGVANRQAGQRILWTYALLRCDKRRSYGRIRAALTMN